MTNEKILINYLNKIAFNNTPTNVIGATANQTLRTVQSNDDTDTKYVRKFGKEYKITDVTAGSITTPRSDGGGTNKWHWEIRGAVTDTLFGTIKDELGASSFVDGSTVGTAEQMIIKLVWVSGTTAALVDGDTLSITTDVDGGGKTWFVSKEVITTGSLVLYAADSGSTYYDALMKFGGFRRTANGTNTTGNRAPFYDIGTAYAALGGAFVNVVILDSETYDEELILNTASSFLFSALGQTPTITNGFGARVTREVEVDGNNSNTIYVDKTGNDSTGDGTFQNTFLTIQKGFDIAKSSSRDNVNVKDSNIYIEDLIFLPSTFPKRIEPIYGEIPIFTATVLTVAQIIFMTGNMSVHGIKFEAATNGIFVSISAGFTEKITDCNFKDMRTTTGITQSAGILIGGSGHFNGEIKKNMCENCGGGSTQGGGGIFTVSPATGTSTGTINNNICFNNSGARGIEIFLPGASVNDVDIKNNLCYGNIEGIEIRIGTTGEYSGDIQNNTLTQNTSRGLFFNTSTGTSTGLFSDIISFNNTVFDIAASGVTPTITESNFSTNSGFVSGSGNISTDPNFCKITTPFKFGLSADSGALKQGTGGEDMGALYHTLKISANDIEINGLNIDGQEFYNNALYQIATRTGILVKWCDVFDYQGIAIDFFGTADTDSEVKNTRVNNNGNGINSVESGNIFQESIIFKNTIFGIFSDNTGDLFNHVVIFGNNTGIKFNTSTSGIIIKNSIFNSNSVVGITSVVSIALTFCCVTDAVSSTIDITDITNIIDSPLFINTDLGTEDFNIKTNEAGFLNESPCKDIGESSTDIGAFGLDRSVSEDSWSKIQLTFNPRNIDFLNQAKGFRQFENAAGSRTDWAKGHKRVYDFIYSDNQFSNEVDRKTLEFLNTLIQTEENARPASDAVMRLSFLPSQGLDSGTAATVDKTAKTVTDAAQTLVENESKGFHLAVQFETGTATGTVDKTAKTLTISPTPSFTVDEHIGFFVFIQNNFFFIKSNTANVLTLSDPDGNLSDASNIDWNIEKYFKIRSNTKTVFTLTDDDGELEDGTFDYIIRFIECKIINPDFKFKQARFFYQQETWKTGYRLTFEES